VVLVAAPEVWLRPGTMVVLAGMVLGGGTAARAASGGSTFGQPCGSGVSCQSLAARGLREVRLTVADLVASSSVGRLVGHVALVNHYMWPVLHVWLVTSLHR
jgi:hypothetical protein